MATAARMATVFWLGGGCGAGKTTVARAVVRRLDLRLYAVDGHTYVHAARSQSGEFPLNRALTAMTAQQRWQRSPAELAETFAAHSAERLPLILADLRDLGPGPTIVAEGPQLFPDLIAPLMQTAAHGLWLLPTPEFSQLGIAPRRSAMPEEALRRRHQRDTLLTEMHREQAARHRLPVAEVDGTQSLAELTEAVAATLQNLPGGLARAATGAERQRIRQAENAVVVRQLLGWWADMGPERMPDPPGFEFSCECETLGCEQVVPLTVTDYQERSGAGPVTAQQ